MNASARRSADPVSSSTAEQVGRTLGHRFLNASRLERALTHASVRNNPGQRGSDIAGDYERLEFLGDRVLGLLVAEMLFSMFPDADEGEMSVRLNALVRTEALAEIADEAGITSFIRTGIEMAPRAARKQKNLKADVMEALIATVYLDGGLEATRPIIDRFWRKRALGASMSRLRDAKTELQEWSHQNGEQTPVYRVVDRSGPDHAPVFAVEVRVGGKAADGQGRSKRDAEQDAAGNLLEALGVRSQT